MIVIQTQISILVINNELNDQRVYVTSAFEIISLEYKEVDGGIFSGLICYFDTICRHKQTHLDKYIHCNSSNNYSTSDGCH